MTKVEYLDMRGFNNETYVLMTKDEVGNLGDKPGAMNNMYAANDPKGKTFGAGAMVVKRSWALEHKEPEPIVEEVKEEVPLPQNSISEFLQIRIKALVNKGWTDESKAMWLTLGDETIPYEELEELENADYTKLIKTEVKEEVKKEPNSIEEEVAKFLCLNNRQSGQPMCKEQCGYCKAQEEAEPEPQQVPDDVAAEIEAVEKEEAEIIPEKLEEVEAKTFEEKPKDTVDRKLQERIDRLLALNPDNLLGGSGKTIVVNGVAVALVIIKNYKDDVFEEFVERSALKRKVEPKLEPTKKVEIKKPEPKPIVVPKASDDVLKSFNDFSELAELLNKAKEALFIVASIRDLLNSKEGDSDSGLSDGEILDKVYELLN